jgi:drug/metabolite transporter (DMT)-like permease
VNFSVLVLILVTLVWGSTFPILRMLSTHLTGIEVSAIRFCIAGLCMAPFALKASRAAWRDGVLLGFFALVSYVAQAVGLHYISANRSAFLTSLNVLIVPFLSVLLGTRVRFQVLAAALLACAGIGLMSWERAGNLIGDGATLVCALAYAIYVVLLSSRAGAHEPRALTATQLVSMAMIGCVWLLGTEYRGIPPFDLLPRAVPFIMPIVYLGVVATAGVVFLQTLAQRNLSAEKAAVIYAMEPVFAVIFGWWWLGETLGARGAIGAALVVVAVIFGEWRFAPKPGSD